MAISQETVELVIVAMKKHLDSDTLKKVFADLRKVPGNRSFKDSIDRLIKKYEE